MGRPWRRSLSMPALDRGRIRCVNATVCQQQQHHKPSRSGPSSDSDRSFLEDGSAAAARVGSAQRPCGSRGCGALKTDLAWLRFITTTAGPALSPVCRSSRSIVLINKCTRQRQCSAWRCLTALSFAGPGRVRRTRGGRVSHTPAATPSSQRPKRRSHIFMEPRNGMDRVA